MRRLLFHSRLSIQSQHLFYLVGLICGLAIAPEIFAQSSPQFVKMTESDLVNDRAVTAAVAVLDYDNDGFLDLYVGNGFESSSEERNFLYHNQGNENHWIKIELEGTVSNRSGVGATIKVVARVRGETLNQTRTLSTRGSWSGHGLRAHYGLGDASRVDSIKVQWPSGHVQVLKDVEVNQSLTVKESLQPGISIEPGVRLSWPWAGHHYRVESASDPEGPWGILDAPVTIEGTTVKVDVEPVGSQMFFRLVDKD